MDVIGKGAISGRIAKIAVRWMIVVRSGSTDSIR